MLLWDLSVQHTTGSKKNMTGKDILSIPIGKIDHMKQGCICSFGAMISHPQIFGTHPEQLGWMPAHA